MDWKPARTLEECNKIMVAGFVSSVLIDPRFVLADLSPRRPFETVERTIKGRTVRTYKNLPSSVRDLWVASAVRSPFSRPH
jgi:hypothetical protein